MKSWAIEALSVVFPTPPLPQVTIIRRLPMMALTTQISIAQAPESISFAAMSRKQQQLVHEILKDPAVASLSSFIGAKKIWRWFASGLTRVTTPVNTFMTSML